MPLVDAKCTNCGAPLKVDNTKDAAICEFCGSAYIVKNAIQNYKYYVTNNISANNVIISSKGDIEKERLLSNAIKFVELGEYKKADELLLNIMNDYPGDYRGYWEYYRLNYLEYNYTVEKYAQKAIYLNPLIKKDYNCLWISFTEKIIAKGLNYGDTIIKKIIKNKPINDIIGKFKEEIISNLIKQLESNDFTGINQLCKGEDYLAREIPAVFSHPRLTPVFQEGANTGDILRNTPILAKKLFRTNDNQIKVESSYITLYGFDGYSVTICFALGNIVGVCYPERTAYDSAHCFFHLTPNTVFVPERIRRMKSNKCQFCGGTFKGLFTKICSKCGKPKDY